ncbi:MAG: metallophosphoesterase, partial [Planctomycetales bacterium]|nr:metallophosphoesterase [Planctomycetales bacterium]
MILHRRSLICVATLLAWYLGVPVALFGQDAVPLAEETHPHYHPHPHPTTSDAARFDTSRESRVALPLPQEKDAFSFVVFGDRTGGPPEGVEILRDAVRDVNLFEPDLVMTVGDLIQGYNDTNAWLPQMREYKSIMGDLLCPWFPVAGNHDIYWRGENRPATEHEADYEMHFGPLWYAFEHKNCWFIALYSDEGDPQTGEKTFNEPNAQKMSPAQFEWLERTLEKAKDAEHVFLFLHHPRWLEGGYGTDWRRVHKLLADAGNVRIVFAGHIHHMRYDGPRDGIEYVTLATVGGEQQALSSRAGYLHHYHVVTVRKQQIAMACLPVGEVMDVRKITGQISDEIAQIARQTPKFSERPRIDCEGRCDAPVTIELFNHTSRTVEFEISVYPMVGRWTA